MKTYIQPTTETIRVTNYLCQNVASPTGDSGYHPLTPGGAGSGQGGAM